MIASAAVALATVAGLTVTASSATADTISQRFTCWPGSYAKTWNITVTAPATVPRGQPAPVYIKVEDPEPWDGSELAPGQIRITAYVVLGGAGSGEVQVQPPLTNPTTIPPGARWHAEGTRQFTFPTAGTVTLAVRAFGMPLYYGCGTPSGSTPAVAERVTVQ
jgi:hypothetical protein